MIGAVLGTVIAVFLVLSRRAADRGDLPFTVHWAAFAIVAAISALPLLLK